MFSNSLALTRGVKITRTSQVYYLGWITLAMLLVINYFGAGYYGLTFTNPEYSIIAVVVLISISLLFYAIFGRNSRVGEMIRYLALWLTLFPVGRAFTYTSGALRFPLI